jgi:hypothetical protein
LNRKEWHGSEMYASMRRMEAMLAAAEEMVGSANDGCSGGYCCRSCLDRWESCELTWVSRYNAFVSVWNSWQLYCIASQRIGHALDEQSSLLLDECLSYDDAASREEERVDSIRRALAGLMQNVSLDGSTDEGSTEWCVETFFNMISKAFLTLCSFFIKGHWNSST